MKILRIMSFLLSLCVASLCACSRSDGAFTATDSPRHFHELKTIEALLESNPEVAMDSVDALKTMALQSPFTPSDYNELLLREVQAQYKNRCLSEQSPDLAQTIVFFDSLAVVFPDDADLQFILANAYYYKGVQWLFANDDVSAFMHYLKALEVMRRYGDWTGHLYTSRFIALTYTRLSEMLYRYGLHDAALETCRKASSYYESETDKAAMLRFEAAIYQSQKQYDKAMARLQEAQGLAPVDADAFQLLLGARFFDIRQYDSAVPHLERAFLTGDRFARVDAAAKLAEIYRDKGMTDEELSYTRFYVENSLMETQMASRKMEIEYLYQDASRPKSQPDDAPQKNKTPLWALSLLLLLALAVMAYIIIRNRRRISHIENKISTIEQKHEQENAAKDHEIEQMAQQLHASRIDFDEAWKTFTSSDIVTKIRHSVEGKDIMIKNVGVYPKLKMKEIDYIGLVQEANRCFPDFSSRFLKAYPDLNIADLRHCCLGLLGMNDAEIAVLEGISYSGANRRTNKILSALGAGDSLENAIINCLKKLMQTNDNE